jgi:hypothetical protein
MHTVPTQNVKANRMLTTLLWVLAMLLPGGLVLLALWMAIKAAHQRSLQRRSQPSKVVIERAPAPEAPRTVELVTGC